MTQQGRRAGAVRVRISGATDVGLVREHNEDSFLVVDLDRGESDLGKLRHYELGEQGTLLLVCDGMGGAAAGEVASAMAVQGMCSVLLREFGPPDGVAPAEEAAENERTEVTGDRSEKDAGAGEIAAPEAAVQPAGTEGEGGTPAGPPAGGPTVVEAQQVPDGPLAAPGPAGTGLEEARAGESPPLAAPQDVGAAAAAETAPAEEKGPAPVATGGPTTEAGASSAADSSGDTQEARGEGAEHEPRIATLAEAGAPAEAGAVALAQDAGPAPETGPAVAPATDPSAASGVGTGAPALKEDPGAAPAPEVDAAPAPDAGAPSAAGPDPAAQAQDVVAIGGDTPAPALAQDAGTAASDAPASTLAQDAGTAASDAPAPALAQDVSTTARAALAPALAQDAGTAAGDAPAPGVAQDVGTAAGDALAPEVVQAAGTPAGPGPGDAVQGGSAAGQAATDPGALAQLTEAPAAPTVTVAATATASDGQTTPGADPTAETASAPAPEPGPPASAIVEHGAPVEVRVHPLESAPAPGAAPPAAVAVEQAHARVEPLPSVVINLDPAQDAAVAPLAAAGATADDGAPDAVAPESSIKVEADEAEVDALARRLRDAVYAVNLEIFSAACADVSKAGMGTTLTGLLLQQTRVLVTQVGDSRAYLWRRGTLTQITHDQSLVNQLLDTGQITPDQAKLFEHSNVILQALGVQEDVEVLISTERLRRGDRILLCSDGLVGVVSDEEIQEVLGLSEDLDDTVKTLIDMARAAGGPDNITVIVAEVDGDELPPPGPEDNAAYRPLALDPPAYATSRFDDQDRATLPGLGAARDPAEPLSLATMLSMAWVIGLLLAGLVVSYLLYPHETGRAPPRGGLCYFLVDRPGLEILVDGEAHHMRTSSAGTEVRLAPGDHWIALRDDSGPVALQSERQQVHVSPGQPCALRLRAPRSGGAAHPIRPSTPE